MRFPVIGDISTKDGDGNKNARLTNTLAEQKKNGTTLATVRPGLNQVASTTGNGNNLVCFGGELVNIYGNTVYKAVLVGGAGAEYSINYLPIADHWYHVIWTGSKFCAVGTNYSATSEDGLTWEYGSMPFAAWWTSVAWNGTIFCAVMYGLSIYSPYVHACATSTDGLTWTARELPTTDEEDENGNSDIASNGSLFVTAAFDAGATCVTSTDGITWTSRALPAGFASGGALFAYGSSKFLAVTPGIYAATSSDGITWSSATAPTILPGNIGGRRHLCYANDKFVIVSGSNCQYSTTGTSWSSSTLTTPVYSGQSVVWDGTKYLAIGIDPPLIGGYCSLADSLDCVTWNASSLPDGWWFSAASNGTNVVMVGSAASYANTDSHLINISDPSYTLESIGTMADDFFDFALIP